MIQLNWSSWIFLLGCLFLTVYVSAIDSNGTSAEGLRAGYLKESTSSCSYEATCTVSGVEGVCVDVATGCCNSGVVTAGLCPGASSVECCTQPKCSTPYGSGSCLQTSVCASQAGYSVPGYCTGPSDLQCCVHITPPSNAVYGVDMSTTLSSSSAPCLVSNGKSFAIPRGYQSLGQVDPNVCTSLINAYNAGFKTRDVYLFPCPTCSIAAATQMSQLVNFLNANCKSQWSGRVWLDIEGSQYWTGNANSNQAFFKALVESCTTYGVRCGIYSSASQWSSIFGSLSFCYGNSLPLWYAHYDNIPSFADFTSFGCFASPYAKQYGGGTICGITVDYNYAPSF